eukprot:Sspe_Gene.86134::Locus_56864_Transcript_1_1_Confidence_1.000_Length_3694::g.86134::m.86134
MQRRAGHASVCAALEPWTRSRALGEEAVGGLLKHLESSPPSSNVPTAAVLSILKALPAHEVNGGSRTRTSSKAAEILLAPVLRRLPKGCSGEEAGRMLSSITRKHLVVPKAYTAQLWRHVCSMGVGGLSEKVAQHLTVLYDRRHLEMHPDPATTLLPRWLEGDDKTLSTALFTLSRQHPLNEELVRRVAERLIRVIEESTKLHPTPLGWKALYRMHSFPTTEWRNGLCGMWKKKFLTSWSVADFGSVLHAMDGLRVKCHTLRLMVPHVREFGISSVDPQRLSYIYFTFARHTLWNETLDTTLRYYLTTVPGWQDRDVVSAARACVLAKSSVMMAAFRAASGETTLNLARLSSNDPFVVANASWVACRIYGLQRRDELLSLLGHFEGRLELPANIPAKLARRLISSWSYARYAARPDLVRDILNIPNLVHENADAERVHEMLSLGWALPPPFIRCAAHLLRGDDDKLLSLAVACVLGGVKNEEVQKVLESVGNTLTCSLSSLVRLVDILPESSPLAPALLECYAARISREGASSWSSRHLYSLPTRSARALPRSMLEEEMARRIAGNPS